MRNSSNNIHSSNNYNGLGSFVAAYKATVNSCNWMYNEGIKRVDIFMDISFGVSLPGATAFFVASYKPKTSMGGILFKINNNLVCAGNNMITISPNGNMTQSGSGSCTQISFMISYYYS